MTNFVHVIMSVARNLLFCLVTILLITLNSRISVASEWYENGTLYQATFQQWKTATHSNKLATCAGFILAAVNDGYFLLDNQNTLQNTQNTELLKTLAEILVNTNDAFINNSTHLNDTVSEATLLSMLTLEWIKPDYLAFLASSAHQKHSSKSNETSYTPQKIHKGNSNKKNGYVNPSKTQIVSVKKYRLMPSAEGRKWVKKNIIPAMFFSENEFVERFGNYEKVTNSLINKKTLEKYYFKHIDITFFVVQEDKTLIGFCNGKGYLK